MAEENQTLKYKLKSTPRAGLIAPKGYSIAAVDWSGQEAMIGAYYSQDKKMLDIFRSPLTLPSGKANPEADIHCYTQDTEVLTKEGWKTFDQVSRIDAVCQYNPRTNQMSWTWPKEIVWEWYEGQTVRLQNNQSVDLEVTPNHRMLVFDSNKDYRYKTVQAKELYNFADNHSRIPLSGVLEEGMEESSSFLNLLILFEAKGKYLEEGIKLSLSNNLEKFNQQVAIISNLCDGTSNYWFKSEGPYDFAYIYNQDLENRLRKYIDNKGFTHKLIHLSQKAREYLIGTYPKWQGRWVGGSYILDRASPSTIKWLQTLCHLTGYKAIAKSYKKSGTVIKRLNIHSERRPWAMIKGFLSNSYYKGYVGCVSVKTGYILVRRNGKVCISGNTINAMNCTHPHLFRDVPEEKLVETAKNKSLITEKGSARDWAKCLQYGIQYLQGAKGMADLHNIPEKRAQQWIDQHEMTFPRYHKWVKEQQHLAEVRGWAQTPHGSMRFVREDNAKAAGSSPGRSGVNHLIQSYGATMAKKAIAQIWKEMDMDEIKIINAPYDEICVILPGETKLDFDNSKIEDEVITKPAFIAPDYTQELAEQVATIMKEVEEEMFEGMMEGRVEIDLAPYWSH